jgi:hypothetical protein
MIGAPPDLPERPAPEWEALPRRRVLMLGWNHRVPALLEEFDTYPNEMFAIDIVSQVSATKRKKRLAAEALATDRLEIRQIHPPVLTQGRRSASTALPTCNGAPMPVGRSLSAFAGQGRTASQTAACSSTLDATSVCG